MNFPCLLAISPWFFAGALLAVPLPAEAKEIPLPAPRPALAAQPLSGPKGEEPASSQAIDDILSKAWKQHGISPNPPASDEVFLRRVYLDVIGRIPSHGEAMAFLDSKDRDKRARLIDELLASEGYVNHFFNYWADILRINTAQPASQNITPFYIQWVREALAANMPYDEFVRALLTAEGHAWDNGAIGYYFRDRGMALDHMANTVRIFLGTRLECAQCHDHPFDTWTQMDFYHMAAFTYGVNANDGSGAASAAQRAFQKSRQMSGEEKAELRAALTEITRQVRNNNQVSYRNVLPKLPHDYQYDDAKPNQTIGPRTMFGADPAAAKPEDRVRLYAEWMTSPENPLFTRVIANRLWKKLMGLGLHEPVDEFTEGSQPSHPELMTFLEERMVASGYDLKAFLRLILNSGVYQRTAAASDLSPEETYHFPGPILRRMSAEQIWDSIVTLVNPTPEMGDWKREQQFALRMAEQKSMLEALENAGRENLVSAAKQVAGLQAELEKEDSRIRRQIEAARAAGQKQRANDLSREAGRIRSRLREKIMEVVFRPEMERLGVETVSMDLPNGDRLAISPTAMDGDGLSSSQLRKQQTATEKNLMEEEMNRMGLTDPQERSAYLSFRRESMRMLRAAHIGSPAPLGHFLREFGQSDRDTIENANHEASVPQALQLLNGAPFSQVAHPQSVLSRNVRQAKTPGEKIDTIFVSLLCRKPAPQEREILLKHAGDRGANLYADTAFALMNGQEFWYVQ